MVLYVAGTRTMCWRTENPIRTACCTAFAASGVNPGDWWANTTRFTSRTIRFPPPITWQGNLAQQRQLGPFPASETGLKTRRRKMSKLKSFPHVIFKAFGAASHFGRKQFSTRQILDAKAPEPGAESRWRRRVKGRSTLTRRPATYN